MNTSSVSLCNGTVCIPVDAAEQARMQALQDLGLLDTEESESFDRITRMASQFLSAPVSAVSLTDSSRQWFKSHVGTAGRELPRDGAPCAEVTRSQAFLHVTNLLDDPRFADSPLAKAGIRFYAGAPLTTRGGHTLGAMCVLDSVPRALSTGQMRSLEDFAAMVMSQIELQHEFGRIDPSSGLPNRHQLYDDIEDQKRHTPAASRVLLLIELADLRHVDEAVTVLGASYLDELIKVAAQVVRIALGRKVTLYQVGFASLALLLDEEHEPWQTLVETIAEHLRRPAQSNGIPIAIAAAYGISPFALSEAQPHDVLRTAVSAAHDARAAELESAVYSVDSDKANRRRFHLLTHVRESLEQEGDFHLVYQPRLDLHTGKYLSAEALLRWTHPQLGNVSPGEFIPLVEQTALTRPITQWVMEHAMRQIRAWRDANLSMRVSINISARNLEEEDFAASVAAALARHDLSPSDVELEFTESALIRHQAKVLAQLDEIRKLGVELAIDDFGTGYSSFAYLRQLPATTVKLDQSFMRSLASNVKDRNLVHSMVALAHDIGYRVVAEGVETAEVLEILRGFGCDEIQGYFLSRPLTVPAFTAFVANSKAVCALAA